MERGVGVMRCGDGNVKKGVEDRRAREVESGADVMRVISYDPRHRILVALIEMK